jgi:hypothetical protein
VDYHVDVSNRFAPLGEENEDCDTSPNSQWGVMKEVVQNSANKTLTVRACPKKPWISMETMDLIEAKRKLTRGEADHRTLSRQVKQAVKKDRKAVLTETCRSIEEAGKRNDSKGMFNLINRFKRKVASKCSNIRGIDGKLLTEATQRESWVAGIVIAQTFTKAATTQQPRRSHFRTQLVTNRHPYTKKLRER